MTEKSPLTITNKNYKKYISVGLIAGVCFFLYKMQHALAPFIISLAIAFILRPIVDFFEKKRVPRWITAALLVVSVVVIIVSFFIMLIPFFTNKTKTLLEQITNITGSIQNFYNLHLLSYAGDLEKLTGYKINEFVNSAIKNSSGELSSVMNKIIISSSAIFEWVVIIAACPIIIFYLLRDWSRMWQSLKNLMPKRMHGETTELFADITSKISSYLYGQILVCLFLGAFYGVGLVAVGLKKGLVVGMLTGFLSFIPYIGFLIGFMVSVIMAIMQFSDVTHIVMVIAVLIVGQVIEGNFVTPKIIGDKIDLHPILIIFGLFTSVALFGGAGAILALPITVVGSVLAKFGIRKYRHSSYYLSS